MSLLKGFAASVTVFACTVAVCVTVTQAATLQIIASIRFAVPTMASKVDDFKLSRLPFRANDKIVIDTLGNVRFENREIPVREKATAAKVTITGASDQGITLLPSNYSYGAMVKSLKPICAVSGSMKETQCSNASIGVDANKSKDISIGMGIELKETLPTEAAEDRSSFDLSVIYQ